MGSYGFYSPTGNFVYEPEFCTIKLKNLLISNSYISSLDLANREICQLGSIPSINDSFGAYRSPGGAQWTRCNPGAQYNYSLLANFPEFSNIEFKNCVIDTKRNYANFLQNTTFTSNIFNGYNHSNSKTPFLYPFVDNTFINNIFTNYNNDYLHFIYTSSGLNIQENNNLFVINSDSDLTFSDTSKCKYDTRFRLSANSVAKNAGLNGTDCGMFGGDSPYISMGIPDLPAIEEFEYRFFKYYIDNYRLNPIYICTQAGIVIKLKAKSNNSSNLVDAEYFYGNDPGFGNGIKLKLNNVNQNYYDTVPFPTNFDGSILWIRTKNSNGKWSHTNFYSGYQSYDVITICSSLTQGTTIDGINTTTGIYRSRQELSSITIFPNPSQGTFTIQSSQPIKENIQIFNALGVPIQTLSAKGQTNVQISGLTSGLYLVQIGKYKQKVVVD